jgi:tRNA-specific adenosine deaminase 1
VTYHQLKQEAKEYQAAKKAVQGQGKVFSGWVKSGSQFELFALRS